MSFTDDWKTCMDTMGMPTPSEVFHTAEEVLDKLHEAHLALGGVELVAAAEALHQMGFTLGVAPEAGLLTVSWWSGNAIGCVVTAVFRDQIADAIDWIVSPINWPWIEDAMNRVGYPIPAIDWQTDEEVSIRSSSVAQDDAPPNPILRPDCTENDWVEYAQGLLNLHGYDVVVDGRFGPKTTAAVRDFRQRNGLGDGAEIDHHMWKMLEVERR